MVYNQSVNGYYFCDHKEALNMKDKVSIAIVVAIFVTQYFYSLFIAKLMPSAEVNLVVNILVSLLVIASVVLVFKGLEKWKIRDTE